ncbi:MAG TPA: AAA family ATPase, partial [Salinimicrobium catena]|nr:AAA family ATPase [Salinimicrobium catena]
AEGILDNRAAQVRFIQELAKGTNSLIRKGLLEVEKAGFLNTSYLKLTEKGLELLENEGLEILDRDSDNGLLLPEKIPAKRLFFNPDDLKRIMMLEDSLQEEKLLKIRARLEKRNLPRGITAILHGPPGTGKTESVFQMARKTGRKIMKVEISETKSKWFGDSEKIIKEIFSKYKRSLYSCDKFPILLFNEADAILSRRKDIDLSGVAQTENAIQNILLEELENFEGIFIATTNLISNLDAAFERRFLFKIGYEKPATTIKQKIWQDRIPSLSATESLELAKSFDLSGGEIENICRKILIEEVLHDDKVTFQKILEFCRTEKFIPAKRNHIGFGKL